MFGYVLPVREKLPEKERAVYRAAYCGLCRSLKHRYGFRARFFVNYDMTFLYFLLQRQPPGEPLRCACPARLFCKKECLADDGVMGYAADLSVLLSYWKLRDARQDGGFFRAGTARMLLLFYRRCYRKAAARQPQRDALFSELLTKLRELEQAHCTSLDRAADAFAKLLEACAPGDTPDRERPTRLLLYHVGRFLYLTDALEDLPKDNRSGSYNPLRYRFTLHDGKLTDADSRELRRTIEASVSMAASALSLLPESWAQELLYNIIYYGLPAVLQAVAAGTFRKRGTHE